MAWGLNNTGELGSGSLGPEECKEGSFFRQCSTTPVAVKGLGTITALSVGGYHSLALLEGGTVEEWGENESYAPIPVPELTGVTAVAAGYYHSLARLEDGTVVAWGSNAAGQLGAGEIPGEASQKPIAVNGLTNDTSIAAGPTDSLALLKSRTVVAWGRNNFGQLGDGTSSGPESCESAIPCSRTPVTVSGLSGVAAIAEGETHALALLKNGTVWAWGNNHAGQLGNGTNTDSSVPVQVSGLTGVTAISAGRDGNLALLANGKLMAWGSANFLANGTCLTDSNVPIEIASVSGITKIAAGGNFATALRSNGTVLAWGKNTLGQLGIGTSEGPETCAGASFSGHPVEVTGLSGVTGIAIGAGSENAAVYGQLAPKVSELSEESGPEGGEGEITITGSDLAGATTVMFGTHASPLFKIRKVNAIVAVVPPGSGTVAVTVTTPRGKSTHGSGDMYTYISPPSVTKVSPKSGPTTGGTSVMIKGKSFAGATAVDFGGNEAKGFVVSPSGTSITAESPSGATGTVDVTVTAPNGKSAPTTKDRFTYGP
jgi:alpha-tubulin suppressor-like RCC1 family protein